MNPKKVLIIGATSAIAIETAKLYAAEGATLILVGRDNAKLISVKQDLEVRYKSQIYFMALDANDYQNHQLIIDGAVKLMGGLDIALIAHGVLPDQKLAEKDLAMNLNSFHTNCLSVISLSSVLANYFEEQKKGKLAVISSVAGDRGRQSNYIYGASKAGVNAFTQGLRNRLSKSGVSVTTIKPGFVDTPMTAHLKKNGMFASPQKVGKIIYNSIEKGKDVVYAPSFWRLIMFVVKHIPESIFKKLSM